MKAADIMVANVITVSPNDRVRDVAGILLTNRISAVPVVDERGKLVGIVSEGDLMQHVEAGSERRRSWWLELSTGNETLAAEYVKAHSRKVTDVMTREVISAGPDTPIGDIAALLEKNGIKRVPIVKDGKIVGIVSRANLIQSLASFRNEIGPEPLDDSTLREKVLARLKGQPWIAGSSLINVRSMPRWSFLALSIPWRRRTQSELQPK